MQKDDQQQSLSFTTDPDIGEFEVAALLGESIDSSPQQTFSCSENSFSAASPRGDLLRPLAKSPSVDTASPVLSLISDNLSPDACKPRIRDAHVVMRPSLRYPVTTMQRYSVIDGGRNSVNGRQRHSVTEFRYKDSMAKPADKHLTIGARIRDWRKRRGLSVKDLAASVGLVPSTLYDLELAESHSTTKLHLIAAKLKLNTHYLETGEGDPEDLTAAPPDDDQWPFKFSKSRLHHLNADELELVEAALIGIISRAEAKKKPRKKAANTQD